jgi:SAM-dependent methyltransferase
VIEHLANPIGALREWLRVLRPAGYVLMVAPHKEGCADHRRPTTSLEHLRHDEARATGETDLTHVHEVIALHDLARDPAAGSPESHRRRTLTNASNRAMHHHVFTTRSLLRLLDHVGLKVLRAEVRWPHDIYVLACAPAAEAAQPDNEVWLARNARLLRTSPFRSDRMPGDGV